MNVLKIHYYQLRNLFATKTFERIISLGKKKIKKKILDVRFPILVWQVLDMPNYYDYYQTLNNYLPTPKYNGDRHKWRIAVSTLLNHY